MNRRARTFVAGTDLAALILTGGAVSVEHLDNTDIARFGLLVAMAIGYAEVAGRVELIRRYLGIDSSKAWTSYTSVWAFAGVMTLPAGAAAVLTATVYAHVLILGCRSHNVRPHRLVFSAATMVLATIAADMVSRAIRPGPSGSSALAALAVGLALAVFWLVNLGGVVSAMVLATRPARFASVLPDREGVLLEYVTLALGVVTGVFVVHTVVLTPLVFVLIATTHRSSLVSELRVAASTDPKTGLLNAAAWRERSRQAVSYAARNDRPVCVLVLDLDLFKAVNDRFGHLAGDQVLVRVADTLRTEVRDHDLVGRFGGEEFVIFLDATSLKSATATAERLRERVARGRSGETASVTVSIGVAYAVTPGASTLDDLIGAADGALYAAKDAGRNRVHTVQVGAPIGLSRAG